MARTTARPTRYGATASSTSSTLTARHIADCRTSSSVIMQILGSRSDSNGGCGRVAGVSAGPSSVFRADGMTPGLVRVLAAGR